VNRSFNCGILYIVIYQSLWNKGIRYNHNYNFSAFSLLLSQPPPFFSNLHP
jgi:hypothetical protein